MSGNADILLKVFLPSSTLTQVEKKPRNDLIWKAFKLNLNLSPPRIPKESIRLNGSNPASIKDVAKAWPFGPFFNLKSLMSALRDLGTVTDGEYPISFQNCFLNISILFTCPVQGCVIVLVSGSVLNFSALVAVSIVRTKAITRFCPLRIKGIRSPKEIGIPSFVHLHILSLKGLPER